MARRKYNTRRRRRKRNFRSNKVRVIDENQQYTKPMASIVRFRGVGFPRSYYTKLVYYQTLTFNSAAIQQNIFRANSIFDPDYTGVGAQPMWHDEFALLYNRYTVYASKITASFIQKSGSGESAYTNVWVMPKDVTTLALASDDAIETNRCKSSVLGPNTGGDGTATLSHYQNIANIIGKPKSESSDDILSAPFGSNPGRQSFWHVGAGTIDGLTNVNIYVKVKMVYYCRFFALNTPVGS